MYKYAESFVASEHCLVWVTNLVMLIPGNHDNSRETKNNEIYFRIQWLYANMDHDNLETIAIAIVISPE